MIGAKIVKGDADFVKEMTGFSIGGVPPLGHKEEVALFVDEDLLKFAELRLLRSFGYPLALQHAGGKVGSGAPGYLSESEVARLYRDATAGTIAAGASELVREIIFDSVDS